MLYPLSYEGMWPVSTSQTLSILPEKQRTPGLGGACNMTHSPPETTPVGENALDRRRRPGALSSAPRALGTPIAKARSAK